LPGSGGSGEKAGVGDLPELDRGGHGPSPSQGHAPAAGMRDLGHQPVCVKATEQTCDLVRTLLGFRRQRVGGVREAVAQVTVGETVWGVFPGEKHLEEHPLGARKRVEGPYRSAVFGRCVAGQRI
jgi:hypothetical protein